MITMTLRGIDKWKRTAAHHDLDALAGTWCKEEEEEFYASTRLFGDIDEGLWK